MAHPAAHELATPGVIGAGVCTSLGLSTRAAHAAMRAGMAAFTERPLKGDAGGPPIRMAPVARPGLGELHHHRISALLVRAMADLALGLPQPPWQAGSRVGLFLGLPDEDTLPATDAQALLDLGAQATVRLLGVACDARQAFTHGRSAFFFALEAAQSALQQGRCDIAIVGGADSLCTPEPLQALWQSRRLLVDGVQDGLVPGEGAAFFALARAGSALAHEAPATILCVGTGAEPRHFRQPEPCLGQGLTELLRALRTHASVQGQRVDLMLTCENGERFWTAELSLAYFRNVALMPEPFSRTMSGEVFGDLGAASGAVQMAMGLAGLERPLPDDRWPERLLVCGSSDDGHLGACVVQGNPRREKRVRA